MLQHPNMPQQFSSVDCIHLPQRMTCCPEAHLKGMSHTPARCTLGEYQWGCSAWGELPPVI
ncbi:hypothetical protein HNQ08_004487 [Deinococcus humi]|uniref:Uncharacterized protein n=1 Tax=Deinococcus humi TaxID=662880 RepID=A0A7W8K0S5_9DEIO|nr:hypothetical protein [Deinococcus humi]